MRAGVTLAILLACAGVAWADFQAGLEAWNKGDYRAAFDQFKPGAEQGDAKAQFYLGEAFNLGRGTVQDYVEALKWYRKAAEQGQPEAHGEVVHRLLLRREHHPQGRGRSSEDVRRRGEGGQGVSGVPRRPTCTTSARA